MAVSPYIPLPGIIRKWSGANKEVIVHLTLLYGLTFLVLMPILGSQLQYSIYFVRPKTNSEAHNTLKQYNDLRLKESNRYLQMSEKSKLHSMLGKVHEHGGKTQVDVALGIVTVSRNRHFTDTYEPHFLTQVVTRFLQDLQQFREDGHHLNIKMFICNVDFDPASYEEAQKLSSIIPSVNRFNHTSKQLVHILEKEKQDYVFCLKETLKYKPRYSLIVEDDAIPNDGFFALMNHFINNYLDHRTVRGERTTVSEKLLYVKLYHPERLLSYINIEPDRLPELFGLGFTLGTALFLVYQKKMFKSHLSAAAFCLAWLGLILYVMALAISIGRPHILELRRLFSPNFYSFMTAPECCTPAMLFSSDGAKTIVNYLERVECKKSYGKDMALETFRRTFKTFKTYMIQPNLVKHIGFFSSVRNAYIDPFVV